MSAGPKRFRRRHLQAVPIVLLSMCGSVIWGTGCTRSPFGAEEIRGDTRVLTGRVVLDDGSTPEGVIVWMDFFGLLTKTDAEGRFVLSLPRQPETDPSTQPPITRHFIYFYLANYTIRVAQVAVAGDDFLYGRFDIDLDGQIRETVELFRLVRISTEVRAVGGAAQPLLDVIVTMQGEFSCAGVVNPNINQKEQFAPVDTLGAVLLRSVETDSLYVVRSDDSAGGTEQLTVCETPQVRLLRFDPAARGIPPGRYEAIPYLIINPGGVPLPMLFAIGTKINQLDANFLDNPIRREGGLFTISY